MAVSRRVLVVGAGAALTATLSGLTGCASPRPGGAGTAAPQPEGATDAAKGGDEPERDLDAAAFEEVVARPGVVVLDVRTPAEYAQGHLPDAVNVDINAPEARLRLSELERETPYAVYCRSGNRSAVALGVMDELGFTDAVHLVGGVGAWTAAGHDLVT